MSQEPAFYLTVNHPDLILEGCQALLRSVVQRIIKKYFNYGRTNYMNKVTVKRVRVTKIVIEFQDKI